MTGDDSFIGWGLNGLDRFTIVPTAPTMDTAGIVGRHHRFWGNIVRAGSGLPDNQSQAPETDEAAISRILRTGSRVGCWAESEQGRRIGMRS